MWLYRPEMESPWTSNVFPGPSEHQSILPKKLQLRLTSKMGIAQMWWKLGMTHVDSKRLTDLTAEVGLGVRIKPGASLASILTPDF
jgi:hypothetical protein